MNFNFSDILMSILSFLKATREWATPVCSDSKFLDQGLLTPQEFIRSGDRLVTISPVWSWSTASPNMCRPHLPRDKQYLIARNITSDLRVQTMGEHHMEKVDGDYCLTSVSRERITLTNKNRQFLVVCDDKNHEIVNNDEEMLCDIKEGDSILSNDPKRRHYTVLISYDKYYRTPRIYFHGYDDTGAALSPELLYEDVYWENAHKTVTLERFPFTEQPMCSIHPCNHGRTMKKIIEQCMDHDLCPTVEQYLFIFLKLFASIIPFVEFDFHDVTI